MTAILRYETEDVDGVEQGIWTNSESGETVVGNDLGHVDDPDEWTLQWTCPECGEAWLGTKIDEASDEFDPAGMSTLHVPCADSGKCDDAAKSEKAVAQNIHNAKAFDNGAYDK